jgi:RNase H-fold protein (predicted Holliday junction resolvase)
MPRILAIDHGTVRIGLALSDRVEAHSTRFPRLSSVFFDIVVVR